MEKFSNCWTFRGAYFVVRTRFHQRGPYALNPLLTFRVAPHTLTPCDYFRPVRAPA
jgi:hypothetical protein